jgi:hypothetical protein
MMFNPLPLAVWLLVLPVLGVESVLSLAEAGLVNWQGSGGWRDGAVTAWGITPALQGWMWDNRTFPPEHLMRYVAFGFLHLGPAQAVLVAAIVAGLGTACAPVLGSARVVGFALAAQAAGAVMFGAMGQDGSWLVGGYPLVFGLAGIYAAVQWQAGSGLRAFGVLAMLVVGRLVMAALMGGRDFIADLGAAAMGFALAAALRPGLRVRLRRR